MRKLLRQKWSNAVVASTLLATSGLAAAYGCPPVFDSIWQTAIVTASGSIESALAGMLESVSLAKTQDTSRILSAIRVLTKQIQVASNQEGFADIQSKKSSAAFLTGLATRKAFLNTTLDYSGPTGQGFDPCGELARSKNMAVAMGESNRDMQEKVVSELDNAPGRIVSDRSAIFNQRIADAKKLYCTPQEVSMGLCQSPGALAGKDTDVANFFTSANVSSPQAAAKSALLNNLFGVPQQAISKEMVATPTGQNFLAAKRNDDAFRSVSQTSMKSIQAMTESRGTGSSQGDSALDAMSKKVGTYSGGDNFDDWDRKKISQSERGLLLEYAKMAALELYMMNTQYQQWERIETNVATWQALRARNTTSSADQKVQNASNLSKVK